MSFKTYVAEDQEKLIKDLTAKIVSSFEENVIEENGNPKLSIISEDKKVVRSAMFYGMSGSGKTRLALELMPTMLRLLQDEKSPTIAQKYLKTSLVKPRTIYINWDRNGTRYDNSERDWPAQLTIGARLAAKYWFKQHPFQLIRQKINELDPKERVALEYVNVLASIKAENDKKRSEDKITALYIINDEFQVAAQEPMVAYSGASKIVTTESLSRAVARVLTGYSTQLFTFSSFVGLGFQEKDIFETLSNGRCPDYCVRRLSIESSKKIIAQELGEAWLKCPHLDRVLAVMGGNARMLEVFIANLITSKTKPENFYSVQAVDDLQEAAQERFNKKILLSNHFVWPMMLSLAGYNVSFSDTVVAKTADREITASDVARASFVSLRGPNSKELWPGQADSLVMDTPLILAKWAIDKARIISPALIPVKEGTKLLDTSMYRCPSS